jgi:nicotinamidase-related amidase
MLQWGSLQVAETLEELVDPHYTALLMWDFARGLAARAFNSESFVQNTKRLLDVARENKVPVFYSRQSDMSWEDIGPGLIRMRMRDELKSKSEAGKISVITPPNKKGTSDGEFVEQLKPLDADVVFEKFLPNAFLGTNLDWRLRSRNIKTLVLTGISAVTGVDGTAREAINRGYYAVIVRDCVSTTTQERYELAMPAMEKLFDIFDSSEIVDAWQKIGLRK